jgi:hypothetical protein
VGARAPAGVRAGQPVTLGRVAPDLGQRLVRAVAVGVVLIGLFVFFFVTPAHDPKPNGLPVVVVGPPAATDPLTQRLEGRDFDVERAESAEAARGKIEDRDAYGAIVLAPPAPRVLVATAASVPAAELIEGIARSAGVRTVVDVKPTDRDDPRGATLNVLTLALVITSILTALVAVQMVPELRALGPRVAASSAAAILGGLVAIGIVKAEGALPGSFVAEVAVVALAVLGIALSSAGLIRLIGPAGTGVPFLIFLMLGNPASGLASAPELLRTPWHPLGAFLPPGALGSALRNVAYFDGAKVVLPLLVLAAYVVIGVTLNQIASRRAQEGPSPAH